MSRYPKMGVHLSAAFIDNRGIVESDGTTRGTVGDQRVIAAAYGTSQAMESSLNCSDQTVSAGRSCSRMFEPMLPATLEADALTALRARWV